MSATQFASFLSHPHSDAEWVEWLASKLEDEAGFKVWLDKWILVPGEPWQQSIARGLDQAETCCVFVGSDTPSGWFAEEVQRALNRQVADSHFRVIPVLTPEGNPDNLPVFTELRTWADFRSGQDAEYAFHVLVQGIRGLPVGRWIPPPPTRESEIDRAVRVRKRLQEISSMADLLERDVVVELQLRTMNDFLGGG